MSLNQTRKFCWRDFLLTCLACLQFGAASAFVDPPQIVPALPSTDSVIDVRIRAGFCDTFFTTGPEDRELEIIGNLVIIRALGTTLTDMAQCIYPPGTFRYRIGQLPVGNYDLQVYRRRTQIPGQLDLVGTASFTVGVSSSVPIPLVGNWGLLVLLMLLGGAGLCGLLARRS